MSGISRKAPSQVNNPLITAHGVASPRRINENGKRAARFVTLSKVFACVLFMSDIQMTDRTEIVAVRRAEVRQHPRMVCDADLPAPGVEQHTCTLEDPNGKSGFKVVRWTLSELENPIASCESWGGGRNCDMHADYMKHTFG